MTFAPLFNRSWDPAFNVFEEQNVVFPNLSVFPEATRDHFHVFFDFTPTSTTTDLDFHFVPAPTEMKFPRSEEVVTETAGAFASAIWANKARPNPRTRIPWAIRAAIDLDIKETLTELPTQLTRHSLRAAA